MKNPSHHILENHFIGILLTDVITAYKCQEKEDTPYNRRTFVRTLFSTIEGVVYVLKQAALQGATHEPEKYSTAELIILKEENYYIASDGEARTTKKFHRIADNFLFAVRMFARLSRERYPFEDDLLGDGWKAFQQAIRIRNRIVHPKHEKDFIILDEELEIAQKAMSWFLQTMWGCVIAVDSMGALKRIVEFMKAPDESVKPDE